MGVPKLTIRIAGFASTTHGFGFAVTEGPERLIESGTCRPGNARQRLVTLNAIIRRARPLFVAAEVSRDHHKSARGREFIETLKTICAVRGIMILSVERPPGRTELGRPLATNEGIAADVARHFPQVAHRLPRRRRLWDGADDRVGLFLAAGAALAGWNHFRAERETDAR